MNLFGSRRHHRERDHHHAAQPHRHGVLRRKDRDRVAGGLSTSIFLAPTRALELSTNVSLVRLIEGALVNPNTTRAGRKQAKRELRAMGRERDTHISLVARIKRAFGHPLHAASYACG